MDFLGIGPSEILLILIVALIFLGPGKIVDFAKTLGKWARVIKRASTDFTTIVTREVEKATKEPLPSPKTEEKAAKESPPSPMTEEKSVPPQINADDAERHP